MGSAYLTNPVVFLIDTLFGLYILAVMLRFLLQWVRADFYNPVSQFIVKITNPPLRFLRKLIPGLGGFDLASVVLMVALQILATWSIASVANYHYSIPGLLIIAVAELTSLLFYIYIFSILIQVILSWVNPGTYNPVVSILYNLNEPLLAPARRLIPPIGGLDLSPMVVIILIYLLRMLILPPLHALALSLS